MNKSRLEEYIEKTGIETHNLIVYRVQTAPGRVRVLGLVKKFHKHLEKSTPNRPSSGLITDATIDLTLQDLHAIIRTIAILEDEKYKFGKGKELLKEFLVNAVDEDDFNKLKGKFRL